MKFLFVFTAFILVAVGCNKDKEPAQPVYPTEGSYMPMEVGNYWRMNDENFTRITATTEINGKLFYEFSYRVGGDVFGKSYYRIDEDNSLIGSYPDDPTSIYTHAKFNINVGEGFYTTGKKDWNDYYVKLFEKDKDIITFEYDMVYHPNLKGQKIYRSFRKGIGFVDSWKEVKIGDKVYKF